MGQSSKTSKNGSGVGAAHDPEQAAKLKSRLAQWQSYVSSDAGAAPDAADDAPQGAAWRSGAADHAAGGGAAPAAAPDGPRTTAVEDAVVVPASYIADLRAAVETERDHARDLATAMARSQALHAVTLQKRALREQPTTATAHPDDGLPLNGSGAHASYAHSHPPQPRRDAPRPFYPPERASGSRGARVLAQVVCAILFSAAGFALVLYFLANR